MYTPSSVGAEIPTVHILVLCGKLLTCRQSVCLLCLTRGKAEAELHCCRLSCCCQPSCQWIPTT